MNTVDELRAKARHWREVARHVTDPQALEAIRDLIAELEHRTRELEDGSTYDMETGL
jgi:hypothetical protein